MTVSSQVSSVSYLGDGVTTLLPVPYYFLEQEHLLVTRVNLDSSTDTLILGSDYSVAGAGNQAGGSITMTSAPAIGVQILIDRAVPATQETDYVPNDPFPAESHERALDKLTMLAQQNSSGLSRALLRPVGKNYYDAEGRQIKNVADPTSPQDAATQQSVADYVADVLATGQGPINNAANIVYIGPNSELAVVQDISGAGGSQLLGHNSETVGDALERGGESNEFAWGNVKQNGEDFASFGANMAPALSGFTKVNFSATGVHAIGSVGTMTAPISIPAFSHFKMVVTITSNAPGNIQFRMGAQNIFDDTPEGYFFSNAAILADGIEQDRILTTNIYTFLAWTSGAAQTSLSLETDTAWAGTISSIEFYPVIPTKFAVAGCGADSNGPHNPVGLKVTGYNRNDMVIGDKFTLGMFYNDGQPLMGAHNCVMGARSLASNVYGNANSAFGSFVLQYNEGTNNVAGGYSCFKLNTKGQENTGWGYKCGFYNTTGYRNTYGGFWSGAMNKTGFENTAWGWYAGRNATGGNTNAYYGSRSGQSNIAGNNNTYLGAYAGYGDGNATVSYNNILCVAPESMVFGDDGVAIGFQAKVGAAGLTNPGGVAIGKVARATGTDGSMAIGLDALSSGSRAISIGQGSKAAGIQSTTLGALAEANGDSTTSLGAQAGRNNTGTNNTFVGRLAGGAVANAFSNGTYLGQNTQVTGSNQVQLGDSATTTYVFGTVQNRSDLRDKSDVEDTLLGIEFIMGLRPVHGRWDMRDDYRIPNEDGTVTVFEKDGSKKRKRLHQWFIAQEVQSLCDLLGVEFGGLQNHAVNGGEDVYSLGYDEFIPPVVRAVQQCWSRLDALEERVARIEGN